MNTTIIPFVLELSLDFKLWTFGLGIIILEDQQNASGLFHAGYDEEFGFSLDIFYYNFFKDYLSKP